MSKSKVTKMDTARVIFAAVMEDKDVEKPRQVFIEAAQNKGMSQKCAETYWNMVRTEAQGADPYRYHKHRKVAGAKATAKKFPAIDEHPWGVYEKDTNKLVGTDTGRDKARKILKDLGGATAGYTVAKREV